MDLVEAARAARKQAYAPYSGFAVGAAVRTPSGGVHVGCNVENAAYPEGICAETAAIAAMVAAGERVIAEVAVVADTDEPITPCGGCRQRIAEFGDGDTLVVMATLAGDRRSASIAQLLPGAFTSARGARL